MPLLPRSVQLRRSFASLAANPGPFRVFDRQAKRLQKNSAALRDNGLASITVDYLRNEVADRMMERLDVYLCRALTCIFFSYHPSIQDIKRKFDTIVDLGSGPGHFAKLLELSKTRKCIMIDSSGALIRALLL